MEKKLYEDPFPESARHANVAITVQGGVIEGNRLRKRKLLLLFYGSLLQTQYTVAFVVLVVVVLYFYHTSFTLFTLPGRSHETVCITQ